MTFRALVRPASRNFPPCLLVHVVESFFQERNELYPICKTVFVCLLSMEQELIQLRAKAWLFLLAPSESSGGSCGKETHPAEHMSLMQLAIQASPAHFVTSQPDGFIGVELVSRATYNSR